MTGEGHRCTRPLLTDYPFCGTHLSQLMSAMKGNSFKRSRVMRTSFRNISVNEIERAMKLWEREFGSVAGFKTDPHANHALLKEILLKRGSMTVGALTDCFNSRLQVRYSPTQVGRAMTTLVNDGSVIRTTTRSKKVTVHKTTVYSLVN